MRTNRRDVSRGDSEVENRRDDTIITHLHFTTTLSLGIQAMYKMLQVNTRDFILIMGDMWPLASVSAIFVRSQFPLD